MKEFASPDFKTTVRSPVALLTSTEGVTSNSIHVILTTRTPVPHQDVATAVPIGTAPLPPPPPATTTTAAITTATPTGIAA